MTRAAPKARLDDATLDRIDLALAITQLRTMKWLFQVALLNTTPDIARDGMAYVRDAEALIERVNARNRRRYR